MPVIKPRTTQKQLVRHITRLYRENNETLFAYAKFIGEPTEYVLNQLVETVLWKDKDFQAWHDANPTSCVPPPGGRKRARGGRPTPVPTPAPTSAARTAQSA